MYDYSNKEYTFVPTLLDTCRFDDEHKGYKTRTSSLDGLGGGRFDPGGFISSSSRVVISRGDRGYRFRYTRLPNYFGSCIE